MTKILFTIICCLYFGILVYMSRKEEDSSIFLFGLVASIFVLPIIGVVLKGI